MEKIIEYTTRGTCARAIRITLEDNVIKEVKFAGGCSGNTQGVAALVAGMTAEEAILQMELLEHSFYVFLNMETDSVSVVYKRNDGAYGLLETSH